MLKILSFSVLLALLTLNFISCSKDPPSEPIPTFNEKLQEALYGGLDSFIGKVVSAAAIHIKILREIK